MTQKRWDIFTKEAIQTPNGTVSNGSIAYGPR